MSDRRYDEAEHQQREAPVNAIEHAAAAGMEVIAQLLEAHGPVRIVVLVQAENPPPGQLNAATTAHGVEGTGHVVSILLEHARECGQAIGLTVNVITAS